MEWIKLEIHNQAERDTVALALLHAGYTVRPAKRKEGNRTVCYLEYREAKQGDDKT